MLRLLRYVVLLAALILWAGGLSTHGLRWLYQIGVVADDYRYGDLYRLSALRPFKYPQPVCPAASRNRDTARTHLYIIGDSFTEPKRLGQSDFRVSRYVRVAWEQPQRVKLDATKRNVLLLETVERHLRERARKPMTELVVVADTSRLAQPSWKQRVGNDLHRTDVEERLQTVLFSQNWAFWFQELKASLTLCWFGRADAKVSLSRDHRAIFLGSDTDSAKSLSSFSPVSDAEVAQIVDSLNATADRYRRLGFDEVYLSLIPNKVSILEPHRGFYNHLIERVQAHPALRVPVVDTYSVFKRAHRSPYLPGDTHWNCGGRQLWLRQVWQTLGI